MSPLASIPFVTDLYPFCHWPVSLLSPGRYKTDTRSIKTVNDVNSSKSLSSKHKTQRIVDPEERRSRLKAGRRRQDALPGPLGMRGLRPPAPPGKVGER